MALLYEDILFDKIILEIKALTRKDHPLMMSTERNAGRPKPSSPSVLFRPFRGQNLPRGPRSSACHSALRRKDRRKDRRVRLRATPAD